MKQNDFAQISRKKWWALAEIVEGGQSVEQIFTVRLCRTYCAFTVNKKKLRIHENTEVLYLSLNNFTNSNQNRKIFVDLSGAQLGSFGEAILKQKISYKYTEYYDSIYLR